MTIWHPTDRAGNHVSATEHPEVARRWQLGHIHNTHTANGSKSLQHELWFDVEATRQHDLRLDPVHQIIPRLEAGKPIELSTGLFTKNRIVPPGTTWKGREIAAIATQYVPDHIAILPDQVGACSTVDGCGVGVLNGLVLIANEVGLSPVEAAVKLLVNSKKGKKAKKVEVGLEKPKSKRMTVPQETEEPEELDENESEFGGFGMNVFTRNEWTDEARAASLAARQASKKVKDIVGPKTGWLGLSPKYDAALASSARTSKPDQEFQAARQHHEDAATHHSAAAKEHAEKAQHHRAESGPGWQSRHTAEEQAQHTIHAHHHEQLSRLHSAAADAHAEVALKDHPSAGRQSETDWRSGEMTPEDYHVHSRRGGKGMATVHNAEEFGVGISRKSQAAPSLTPAGSKEISDEDNEDYDPDDDEDDIGGSGEEYLTPGKTQGKTGKGGDPAKISHTMGKGGGVGEIDCTSNEMPFEDPGHGSSPDSGRSPNRLSSSGAIVGNGIPILEQLRMNLSSPGLLATNAWTTAARQAAAATHHAMAAAHHFEAGEGDSSGAGGADPHTGMSSSDAHQASKWANHLSQGAYDSAAALGDPSRATGSAVSTAAAYQQAALAHRLAAGYHDKAGNKEAAKHHMKAHDAHHSVVDALHQHSEEQRGKDTKVKPKKKGKKEEKGKVVKNALTGNSISHDHLRHKLEKKLGAGFRQDQESPHIHEVHNDHVIYHHGGKTYRHKYRLNKHDEPELSKSGPKCVVAHTTYEDADKIFGPGGHSDNPSQGAVFADNVLGETMTRADVVNHLCTNCSCFKGKEQLLNNAQIFTDEQLVDLLTNTAVAQTMRSSGIAIGDKKITFNAGENKFVLNKKTEGSNSDETGNAPEVSVGDEEEDDYEDEMEGKGAKKDVRAGLGIRKTGHKPPKYKAGTEGEQEVTGNAAAQWFANAPPAIQNLARNYKAWEDAQRKELATRLTTNANVAPQAKKALFNQLMQKELDELQLMASLAPPQQIAPNYNPFMGPQPTFNQQVPNPFAGILPPQFLGQGIAPQLPTFNQGGYQPDGEGDSLELPTMNFDDKAAEMEFLKNRALSGNPDGQFFRPQRQQTGVSMDMN
jgi:hypothetical protein